MVKLIDHVRGNDELDIILNEGVEGHGMDNYGKLTRLKLALKFNEKQVGRDLEISRKYHYPSTRTDVPYCILFGCSRSLFQSAHYREQSGKTGNFVTKDSLQRKIKE